MAGNYHSFRGSSYVYVNVTYIIYIMLIWVSYHIIYIYILYTYRGNENVNPG